MPLDPLAEVTLGLRSTPIRITTVPSSVSSVCSISSISSNVTKVSAQKGWVPWGHAPLGHGLGPPGLGMGSDDQGGWVGAGTMVQRLWLFFWFCLGFFFWFGLVFYKETLGSTH